MKIPFAMSCWKGLAIFLAGILLFTSVGAAWNRAYAQDIPEGFVEEEPPPPVPQEIIRPEAAIEMVSPYLSIIHQTTLEGIEEEGLVINGPPEPPADYAEEYVANTIEGEIEGTLPNFPAFNWVFGCSAVSAAMIATYYDRGSYPNMYTGPTNGGVMPLNNSSWPTWSDGYKNYPNNPLIASKNGIDGRTTRGSIDDYWVKYESTAKDPYITNGWTQHTWGTAIGDYMKTSQSAYNNTDGSTVFWNYSTSTDRYTCADLVARGHPEDGTVGRKLFYEKRGYTVTDCYNQKTDNNGGGFTLASYKAQIDAGHPVLLNLAGHSVVGYGYSGSTVYIRDTWDTNSHTMTWGGSYDGMKLLSVSVVRLKPPSTNLKNKNYLPLILKPTPNKAPTNLTLSATSVKENLPINTVVGKFTTSDPDAGNTFTYKLVSGTGSTDNASFNVSGNQLRTSKIFDYETKKSYAIRVRTTDQGGLYFEKAFTISIIDVAEGTVKALINGNFELGHTGWTEYALQGSSVITTTAYVKQFNSEVAAHGGSYLVWLGGKADEVDSVSQNVTVPGSTPYLHYWFWAASAEETCGYDYFQVKWGSTLLVDKDLCDSTDSHGWVHGVVNLSSYSLTNATIKFEVTTDSLVNSNLFLDDVYFSSDGIVKSEESINGSIEADVSFPEFPGTD